MNDVHDSLWIMTRAEIDALRAKVKRQAEVLETTRAMVDATQAEKRALQERLAEIDAEQRYWGNLEQDRNEWKRRAEAAELQLETLLQLERLR